MRKMPTQESTCDVVFLVDGKEVPAHRGMVACSSPYFEKLLANGQKEWNQSRIELKEIKSAIFAAILDYIYFQSTEAGTDAEMLQIVECTRRFQLEDLELTVNSRSTCSGIDNKLTLPSQLTCCFRT